MRNRYFKIKFLWCFPHNFSLPSKFPRLTSVPGIRNDVSTAWWRRMHTVQCNMSMSNVPDSHNVPIFTVSRVSQTKTTEYLRCFSPSNHLNISYCYWQPPPSLADTGRGDMQSSANFSPDYPGTGTCTCELHISLDIHISLCWRMTDAAAVLVIILLIRALHFTPYPAVIIFTVLWHADTWWLQKGHWKFVKWYEDYEQWFYSDM